MSVRIRMKQPLSLCERCIHGGVVTIGEKKVIAHCEAIFGMGVGDSEYIDPARITECSKYVAFTETQVDNVDHRSSIRWMVEKALTIDPNAGKGYV